MKPGGEYQNTCMQHTARLWANRFC